MKYSLEPGTDIGARRRPRWRGLVPSGQFLRYLLVGGWNTAFGYGTYALLTLALNRRMAAGYMIAAVISNFISITVAFLGYKWFVFKTKGRYLQEWFRCLLVYGVASVPNLLLLPVIVVPLARYGHLSRNRASLLGGAIVTCMTVIYSFFGHKHFSFRRRNTSDHEDIAAG